MNRDDFFALATAAGWVAGTPLTQPQRLAIRQALRAAFTGADKTDLLDAPRVHQSDHNTQTMRVMDVKDAIQGLMEELD